MYAMNPSCGYLPNCMGRMATFLRGAWVRWRRPFHFPFCSLLMAVPSLYLIDEIMGIESHRLDIGSIGDCLVLLPRDAGVHILVMCKLRLESCRGRIGSGNHAPYATTQISDFTHSEQRGDFHRQHDAIATLRTRKAAQN